MAPTFACAQGTTDPTERNFDWTATPHSARSRSYATMENVPNLGGAIGRRTAGGALRLGPGGPRGPFELPVDLVRDPSGGRSIARVQGRARVLEPGQGRRRVPAPALLDHREPPQQDEAIGQGIFLRGPRSSARTDRHVADQAAGVLRQLGLLSDHLVVERREALLGLDPVAAGEGRLRGPQLALPRGAPLGGRLGHAVPYAFQVSRELVRVDRSARALGAPSHGDSAGGGATGRTEVGMGTFSRTESQTASTSAQNGSVGPTAASAARARSA